MRQTVPARAVAVVIAVVVLAIACVLSILIGSRPLSPESVLQALAHPDQSEISLIVNGQRIPRTLVGLVAGAALGVAGAVMQGLTRNPLADPGILGINSGAALAVVIGIVVFGVQTTATQLPFAFAGAALAAVIVAGIAAVGRGSTPVTLALSGAVVAAAVTSITTAILLSDNAVLEQMRFWQVGGLANRGIGVVLAVVWPIALGLVLALALGRSLNVLALGDEAAAALGQRVALARIVGAIATVLLAGAATAAIGPIGFVGLAVPHAVRRFSGPDYRWTLPLSAIVAPALLLVADVIGRVVAYPGELQVGIVTAAIGAPVFIGLVRGRAVRAL